MLSFFFGKVLVTEKWELGGSSFNASWSVWLPSDATVPGGIVLVVSLKDGGWKHLEAAVGLEFKVG